MSLLSEMFGVGFHSALGRHLKGTFCTEFYLMTKKCFFDISWVKVINKALLCTVYTFSITSTIATGVAIGLLAIDSYSYQVLQWIWAVRIRCFLKANFLPSLVTFCQSLHTDIMAWFGLFQSIQDPIYFHFCCLTLLFLFFLLIISFTQLVRLYFSIYTSLHLSIYTI